MPRPKSAASDATSHHLCTGVERDRRVGGAHPRPRTGRVGRDPGQHAAAPRAARVARGREADRAGAASAQPAELEGGDDRAPGREARRLDRRPVLGPARERAVARDLDAHDLAGRVGPVGRLERHDVAAGPARDAITCPVLLRRDEVGAAPGVEHVRAGAAVEEVGPAESLEPVGAAAAEQPVRVRRAAEDVRPGRSVHARGPADSEADSDDQDGGCSQRHEGEATHVPSDRTPAARETPARLSRCTSARSRSG